MVRPTINAVTEARIDEEIEALKRYTGVDTPSHLRAQMIGALWALQWIRGTIDMPPRSMSRPWPEDKLPLTLDEAAKQFRWSAVHDYRSSDSVNGKYVSIYGLGIWEADLESLRSLIPNLKVAEKHRVDHDAGTWLRVDLHDPPR
jgi:hypothetical protein